MAPQTTFPTASTEPLPDFPSTRRKPITIKEKIAAAAAAEAKRTAKALSPPPPSDPDKPAKKRKTKYLPPPDEAFPTAVPRVKGLGAASNRRKKALTTQEKKKEWEVKKRVDGRMEKGRRAEKRKAWKIAMGDGKLVQEAEEEGKEAEGKIEDRKIYDEKKAAKKEKPRVESAVELMKKWDTPSTVQYENKKGSGVLFRPTARAVGEQAAIVAAKKAAAGVTAPPAPKTFFKPDEKKKVGKAFPLMKLPEEIRSRIWKLVVVHHPFCVWPGQKRGREQPDLCMTGREVRAEVLPIYYGSNIFGIDITPLPKPETEKSVIAASDDKVVGDDGAILNDGSILGAASTLNTSKASRQALTFTVPDPVADIKPWPKALESGDQLSKIQHWLFSSTPEIIIPPRRFPTLDEANSLVVYLRVWREKFATSESPPNIEDVENIWKANVEVHREATCVLPHQAQYQRCMVQMTPEWVNGTVDLVLRQAERKGKITAEMVIGLAEVLREKATELRGSKCKTA